MFKLFVLSFRKRDLRVKNLIFTPAIKFSGSRTLGVRHFFAPTEKSQKLKSVINFKRRKPCRGK